MATNRLYSSGRYLTLAVGTGKLSNAPICVGLICGVIQNNADSVTPFNATVDTAGVYNLLVDGVDQSGNSAVAIGDQLYFVVGDTIQISKKNTGVAFGKALGAVASGNHVTTIPVRLG